MSEAVIVSTARSPIGRAFKGSLKNVRPDDLAAAVVTAVLAKIPGLDPRLVEDLYLGCAEPSGEQGSNMARRTRGRGLRPVAGPGPGSCPAPR